MPESDAALVEAIKQRRWREVDGLSPREHALCTLAEKLSATPTRMVERWLRVLRRAERPQTLASRCGKINGLNSGSETWTGIGVVAGFLADMGMIEWFYLNLSFVG